MGSFALAIVVIFVLALMHQEQTIQLIHALTGACG